MSSRTLRIKKVEITQKMFLLDRTYSNRNNVSDCHCLERSFSVNQIEIIFCAAPNKSFQRIVSFTKNRCRHLELDLKFQNIS